MTLSHCHHRWMRVFAPVVWLALVQILVVSLLGSSPEMHECFHPDAHDSHHQCLATDFQSGVIDQVVVAPVVVPVLAPAVVEIVAVAAEVWNSLPVHLHGSLLEHGPPALA